MNEQEQLLPVPAENTAVDDTAPIDALAPSGDESEATIEATPLPATETPVVDNNTAPKTDEVAAQQLHTRLATDFRTLAHEVPQFAAFADVPDAIVTMAVEQDISLFDAYLRHSFYENRRIGEAARIGEMAAKASTGSLAAPPTHPHPEVDAFVSALRQSLR